MKLIIFNGSPRGKKSNTKLLMDEFIKGMYAVDDFDVEMYYLASKTDRSAAIDAYAEAKNVILAFPLYTDSMPGIVKEFIENLSPFTKLENGPAMGFVVQSGFPEAAHSRHIEKYLEKFASRMKSPYLGTIVKGGVEGIQIMPASMTRKLFIKFFLLGKHFSETGEFNKSIIHKLAPNEHMTKFRIFFFKLMQKSRLSNFYWDSQLKQNGVFDLRFDKPFVPN